MGPVTVLRAATAADAALIAQMVAVAVSWRPSAPPTTVAEVMAEPTLAGYAAGWPKEGDAGVIAVRHEPLGAAWWRFFDAESPGYGFVDPSTPEITLGVLAAARSQGIGSQLLSHLIAEARRAGLPALSLSVEPENFALRLYERYGFRPVGGVGGSVTMLLNT
jgi:ribosomal protein S18 acetylase RimI-like enzyme